tara:strand:- start:144 stop:542 length:399 start_codon:yes stop_codon:yes gene_type:complete
MIVGFLGIQFLMEPFQYGTFFAWVIILFSIFYRFTFLLLTIGVFFGIINVLEWHLIFAILFTLPSLLFIFPKQILNFKMRSKEPEEKKRNDFKKYYKTTNQKNMNRFKTKSQNNEVIDGDYEIINENEKNKN